MATLSRRANSLPARTVELTAVSLNEIDVLKPDVEAKVATSPSLAEPHSPPAVATFSPVFDLELGGSCNSTPQQPSRCHLPVRGPPSHGAPQRCATAGAAGARTLHRRPPPATAAAAATSAASNLQKLPSAIPQLPHLASVAAAAPASGGLDRSASDLQVLMWGRRNGGGAASHSAELLTPAGERLSELSKPSSELEVELSRRLRAFRAARIAKQPHSGPDSAISHRATAAALQTAAGATVASPASAAAAAASVPPSGPTPGEIEALASELASDGFQVQILDGTRLSKDARSCLRTLKHRFLVCLGRAPPARRSLQGGGERRGLAGAATADVSGGGDLQQQQQQQERPERLSEPLVVEVRFREQFLIANPTPAYELLLLALPVVFVGPLRRLDAVIDLMAGEVAAVFKGAKRPLPPWRTKGAMLSKWAPAQLGELGRLMMQQQQQVVATFAVAARMQDREQADCGRSWGSAVGYPDAPRLGEANATAAAAAAAQRDPLSEPLFRPPCASPGPWPWPGGRSTTTDGMTGGSVMAAAAGAGAGGSDLTDDLVEEVVPRSNSAPPRTAAGLRGTEAAAVAVGGTGGGGSGGAPQSEGVLEIINMDSLDHLMRETLTSISQVEPMGATAVVVAGRASARGDEDEDAATATTAATKRGATRVVAMAGSPNASAADRAGGGGQRDPIELSFPILPEVVLLVAGAGPALGAGRPMGQQQQQQEERDQQEPQSQVAAQAAAKPPPASPVAPTFRTVGVLSPFACMSVPEQYECEYDDQDGAGGGRAAPWSAQLPCIGGGGSSDSLSHVTLPEFTFKHTALDAHHHPCQYEDGTIIDLDLGRRDAPAGGAWRGPTLPLPTPPRPAALAAATGAAAAGAAAPPPQLPSGVGLAASQAAAVAGLNPAHAPLASGALGLYDNDGGTAAAAAAVNSVSRLAPSASHPFPSGNNYPLQFPKPDTLHITRRSSSDLHRAAEKFKKATSLLAIALRLGKGSGGGSTGGGGAGSSNQQQQQQQKDGPAREGDARAVAGAAQGGAEVAAAVAGGAAASPPGGGVGGGAAAGQVALAGGVMTQPPGDAPMWARGIRTVKWTQPAAAAAAVAPAAAGAARTVAGAPS